MSGLRRWAIGNVAGQIEVPRQVEHAVDCRGFVQRFNRLPFSDTVQHVQRICLPDHRYRKVGISVRYQRLVVRYYTRRIVSEAEESVDLISRVGSGKVWVLITTLTALGHFTYIHERGLGKQSIRWLLI